MSSSFDDQISELMSEFAQQRDQLLKAREEFEKATVSVTSKDRLVEVTLMLTGQVKDVRFHRTDYAAMPPAQLSALLVETLNAARDKAAARAQEAFGSHAGFGANLRESLIGGEDVNDVFKGMGGLFDMFDSAAKKRPVDEEDEY